MPAFIYVSYMSAKYQQRLKENFGYTVSVAVGSYEALDVQGRNQIGLLFKSSKYF